MKSPSASACFAEAVERAVPWLAAIAVALPVILFPYPPMFDLPCHEEIVASMRHFGDRDRYPAGLLVWNLGHPNQLFYFLAWGVAQMMPVGTACKIVVAASVAAVPLAAAHLANHLGASRWTSVAIAPLGLGFCFYFGFVGNLLALSLFLALLPRLDRFARMPTPQRASTSLLALLLLGAAHESALVLGCLSILALAMGRPLVAREAAWRAAPIAVAGVGMVVDLERAMRHMGSNLRSLPRVIDVSLWQKGVGLPQALLGLHGATSTLLPFLILMAAIGLLGAQGLQRARAAMPSAGLRSDEPTLSEKVRFHLDARRFQLLGAALVILYFVFPFSIVGAMWLHARFLAPGVAVLAVALAPRFPSSPWWLTRATSVGAIGAIIALLRPEFAATGALYADLEALLPRIAPGSAVAAIDPIGGSWSGLVFSVGGASARAAAVRGGRMAVSFTQSSPIVPVVVAPEHRWDDSFARMANASLSFEPSVDLHRYRYVLSWTPLAEGDDLTLALSPEATLIGRSGAWRLYESNLAIAPLLSSEPLSSGAQSVRDRLEALRSRARPRGIWSP